MIQTVFLVNRDDLFNAYYLPEIADVFRYKPVDVGDCLKRGGKKLALTISNDLADIVDFRTKMLASLSE